MTQLVKKSDQRLTVRGWFESQKAEIARAVPKHIDPERLIRVALTACNQNPALLNCTKESMLQAVMQSAQLGLMPDGILGQAYLIPYKDKAQFQIGYQGLIELVGRTERISAIIPDVVHAKDKFEYHRSVEKDHFVHTPYDGPDDPGPITHGYCILRRKDGTSSVTVLSIHKIEREHMAHSKAKDSGPWKSHKDAMVKKTMILVAVKYEPKSTELARVVATEELKEQGVEIPPEAEAILDAEMASEPEKSALDKVADALEETQNLEGPNTPPCTKCGKPLNSEHNSTDIEGRPYHHDCYIDLFGPKTAKK